MRGKKLPDAHRIIGKTQLRKEIMKMMCAWFQSSLLKQLRSCVMAHHH